MIHRPKKSIKSHTTGGSDNKKLRFLNHLNNKGSDGDTRPQMRRKLPNTMNDEDHIGIMESMVENEWVKKSVTVIGGQGKQITKYIITKKGKSALKEIKTAVKENPELAKLDVFKEF